MYAPNQNKLMEAFTYLGILIGLPLLIWFSVFDGDNYTILIVGLVFAIGGRFLGHGLDVLAEKNGKNKKHGKK